MVLFILVFVFAFFDHDVVSKINYQCLFEIYIDLVFPQPLALFDFVFDILEIITVCLVFFENLLSYLKVWFINKS